MCEHDKIQEGVITGPLRTARGRMPKANREVYAAAAARASARAFCCGKRERKPSAICNKGLGPSCYVLCRASRTSGCGGTGQTGRFSGSSYVTIASRCTLGSTWKVKYSQASRIDRSVNWLLTPFKDRDFPFDLGFLIPLR